MRILSILLVIMTSVPAWSLDLIPGVPYSDRAGFKETGEPDPIIYVIDTTTITAPLVNSTRNGVAVKVGGLKSAINAHEAASAPGIILFETSGTMAPYTPYKEYVSNNTYGLYVAGESAPSPGVTLKGWSIRVNTARSTAWSHLRFRVGDEYGSENPDYWRAFSSEADWMAVVNCSFSWGIDTNFEVSNATYPDTSTDCLVYRCIISEGLASSYHSKGQHSKGGSFLQRTERGLFLENLFAHNRDRNPYLQSSIHSTVNNLVYNWKDRPMFVQWSSATVNANLVNNVIIAGLNTATAYTYHTWLQDLQAPSQLYIAGNRVKYPGSTVTQSSYSDWENVNNQTSVTDATLRASAFIAAAWPDTITPRLIDTVEETVLQNAGARPADRDAVDTRIVDDVTNGTGYIIDSQYQVGGWPTLAVNTVTHTDLPADPHGDADSDGYTNIEEWLHVKSAALLPGQGGLPVSTDITSISTSTGKNAYAYADFSQPCSAVFQDRNDPVYTFSTIPAVYRGLDGIKGFCDDKTAAVAATYYTFTLASAGTLYVAWDDRISPPSWLSTGLTDTTDNLTITTTENLVFSIWAKAVTAGVHTINGMGSTSAGLQYIVFFKPGTAQSGTYIASMACPSATYAAGDTIDCTATWTDTPDAYSGDLAWFYAETGAQDLLFELLADTVTFRSRVIQAGMRSSDLNFKAAAFTIPEGTELSFDSSTVDTTFPASLTNTTIVNAPAKNARIPADYKSVAAFLAAQGNIIPGDEFVLSSDHREDVDTPASGTVENPVILDLAGFKLAGNLVIDSDYWQFLSTGPCSNIIGTVTISGDNNILSGVRLHNGYSDSGASNIVTQCDNRSVGIFNAAGSPIGP